MQNKNHFNDYRNTFNTKVDVKNHNAIASIFLDERGNVSLYMLTAVWKDSLGASNKFQHFDNLFAG